MPAIVSKTDGDFDLDFDVDFHSAEVVHEMGELLDARAMHYPSANSALKAEIQSRVQAGQVHSDPEAFLRFVASNTNPHKISFSWSNLLTALANCVKQLSPSPLIHLVLAQNCVHCARAVDQTLQRTFEPQGADSGGPDLFQVDCGHEGRFYEICGVDKLQHVVVDTSDHAAYLQALKDIVGGGGYACISVPVASADGRFGHAMNIVNAGPGVEGGADRVYIVCGQSSKVFDLSNADDAAAFCARHANTASSESSDIYFTPPRGATQVRSAADAVQAGIEARPPEGALLG